MCTSALMLCDPCETRVKLIFRSPDNSEYAQDEQLKWLLEYGVELDGQRDRQELCNLTFS